MTDDKDGTGTAGALERALEHFREVFGQAVRELGGRVWVSVTRGGRPGRQRLVDRMDRVWVRPL